jgi:hypothetical protein
LHQWKIRLRLQETASVIATDATPLGTETDYENRGWQSWVFETHGPMIAKIVVCILQQRNWQSWNPSWHPALNR